MALQRDHVATRLLCTALLVLWACFAVGLCRPQKRYGSPVHLRASQHLELVQREGRCKFPQPRTVCVPDIYPNQSKVSRTYFFSCLRVVEFSTYSSWLHLRALKFTYMCCIFEIRSLGSCLLFHDSVILHVTYRSVSELGNSYHRRMANQHRAGDRQGGW